MNDQVNGNRASIVERALHNPLAVLQLCLCGTFSAAFVASLIAWGFGAGDLQSPMLLLGVSVIALGLTVNRSAIGVILAILIVGILVAPREYLLRIAHMIIGPEESVGVYIQKYEGEDNNEIAASSVALANTLVEILEKEGLKVSSDAQASIGDAVTAQQSLDGIAMRVLQAQARFPLGQVIAGPDAIIDMVLEYGDEEFFAEDMMLLLDEGLIDFRGERFVDAVPTELGGRVFAFVNVEGRTDFEIEPEEHLDFDKDRPEPNDMESIHTDGSFSDHAFLGYGGVSWFRFSVESTATFLIMVNSSERDPVIRLYGPDGFTETARDDDGGMERNARIKSELVAGEYYLGVGEYDLYEGEYQISIERVLMDDEP